MDRHIGQLKKRRGGVNKPESRTHSNHTVHTPHAHTLRKKLKANPERRRFHIAFQSVGPSSPFSECFRIQYIISTCHAGRPACTQAPVNGSRFLDAPYNWWRRILFSRSFTVHPYGPACRFPFQVVRQTLFLY